MEFAAEHGQSVIDSPVSALYFNSHTSTVIFNYKIHFIILFPPIIYLEVKFFCQSGFQFSILPSFIHTLNVSPTKSCLILGNNPQLLIILLKIKSKFNQNVQISHDFCSNPRTILLNSCSAI